MPNGWGEQKLYAVQVRYTEDGQTFALDDRLGFRTVELVEDDLPGEMRVKSPLKHCE